MRVLIVEDEEILLKVLVRAFARSGHEVRGSGSGAETAEILAHESFDYVLLDVQLYGLNAPELLTLLEKQGRALPTEKVMIMSAYPESVVKDLFGQNLPYAFLQKPFADVFEVVRRVEVAVLDLKKRQNE